LRLAVLALVVAATGCGSRTAGPSPSPAPAAVSPGACSLTSVTRAQLARAYRDLTRLRTVASRETRYRELGSLKMQNAAGRYLDDLVDSKLDPYRVNRMLDLGISTSVGVCGQCFQMMEASRPIPAMKYDPKPC
jgi:hypothetical protein